MVIKRIILVVGINLASLLLTTKLLPGFSLQGDIKDFLIAAAVLAIINMLVRPIIKLFFLPINILTLGTLRWLVGVAALYILTATIPAVKITSFFFNGYTNEGLTIPQVQIGVFASYVISSILISISSGFLNWLVK